MTSVILNLVFRDGVVPFCEEIDSLLRNSKGLTHVNVSKHFIDLEITIATNVSLIVTILF